MKKELKLLCEAILDANTSRDLLIAYANSYLVILNMKESVSMLMLKENKKKNEH